MKPIPPEDVVSTRVPLHEAIPLTGTIVSGTYTDSAGTEHNIKNYAHGMFQSVWDYPYLSSSANHILDLTVGYSSGSVLSSSTNNQNAKKCNIYNQMAQVLVGFDETSTVRRFDQDGNFGGTATKIDEAIFFNFTRLLTKDEIKKGTFQMDLYTGSYVNAPTGALNIRDWDSNKYLVNSPAGEYTLLHTSSDSSDDAAVGLLYYQAGIAVLTASIFTADPIAAASTWRPYFGTATSSSFSMSGSLTGSTIDNLCNGVRNRLKNVQFNNTTELNSTIYFCRASHNEFNYSSNPTYLSASTIRVKNDEHDAPIAYVTTVGLYSADNELMAVAKVSEPLKKTSTDEITIRVRLDY
jgi:hypothetical protein